MPNERSFRSRIHGPRVDPVDYDRFELGSDIRLYHSHLHAGCESRRPCKQAVIQFRPARQSFSKTLPFEEHKNKLAQQQSPESVLQISIDLPVTLNLKELGCIRQASSHSPALDSLARGKSFKIYSFYTWNVAPTLPLSLKPIYHR
jgi:hypothetical protein